jgi:subtilase family serine protease
MRAKLAATAVTAAAVVLGAAAAATPGAARSSIRPAVAQPQARLLSTAVFSRPPTTAQCEAAVHVACYAPFQFHRAYNTTPLYDAGLTGRGRTIVIVDSFGSPTIRRDLATFDRAFGLPAPPKLTILQPAGQVPPFDPNDATMVGWAEETTPDVEWSHAMAPGANVLLVETPVAETEGTVGFPQIVQAENYVISHRLGDVISQSFGATEETFPSRQSLLDLRSAFRNAATHGVTVLGASGDAGPTDPRFNGTLFTHRVNFWPSSDPLVTSVGGTQLHLDARGDRTRPDNVWNDTQLLHAAVAGGGGLSHIFARPGYQDSVRNVVDGRRGTPDVSLSAAVDGGALVLTSFGGFPAGWHIIGGTSEASPLFAGIVAIAAQAAGHSLGLLNPRLYALAGRNAAGVVDITRGNNTVTFKQGGRTITVRGFQATSGYDLASGLGSVNATQLVGQLAR